MSETLTDQIPPLQHLHRALEELQLQDCPAVWSNNKNFLTVEAFPEIQTHIKSEQKEEQVIRTLIGRLLDKNEQNIKSEQGLFGDVWNIDHLEMFEDPKCAECGADATKRCSKCKSEWYCTRECQVKHWKAHKEMCAILAKGLGEAKEKKENKEVKKKLVEVVE